MSLFVSFFIFFHAVYLFFAICCFCIRCLRLRMRFFFFSSFSSLHVVDFLFLSARCCLLLFLLAFAFNLRALYLYLYLCRAFHLTTIQYARIEAFIHRLYTIYIHKTPCNSINSFSFILQLRFDSLFLCIFPRTFTFQIEAYQHWPEIKYFSSETFLKLFELCVCFASVCMGIGVCMCVLISIRNRNSLEWQEIPYRLFIERIKWHSWNINLRAKCEKSK